MNRHQRLHTRRHLARTTANALGLFLLFATVACGGNRVRGDIDMGAPRTVEFSFEPMVIHAGTDAEGNTVTFASDVNDLFTEAGDYLAADDFENAVRLYDLILENFEDPEYRRVTYYNAGLALEGLDRWAEAGDKYRHVITEWPASDDAEDAFFRLAECEAMLGHYEAVGPLMERVLPRMGLTVEQKFEARLRWGNAMLELRRFDEATEQYRAGLALNDQAMLRFNPESSSAATRPLEPNDPLLAHTYFALGRVYHELFSEMRLVLPEARLTQDLVAKTQLFEQAQESYLQAVRTGNPYWGTAGGFMVGQLFEDYYFDVLATEVPQDFNALEVEVYFEELRAYVEPAMQRALAVYEHNLAMAFRLAAQNQWVEDTLVSVERVHLYLENQVGWEQEHLEIVERRHPHSAFYADHMQFRTEPERALEEQAQR